MSRNRRSDIMVLVIPFNFVFHFLSPPTYQSLISLPVMMNREILSLPSLYIKFLMIDSVIESVSFLSPTQQQLCDYYATNGLRQRKERNKKREQIARMELLITHTSYTNLLAIIDRNMREVSYFIPCSIHRAFCGYEYLEYERAME